MRSKALLRRILISLILITIFLLSACGPKFPPEGKIEKTVEGHTWILAWKAGEVEGLKKLSQCDFMVLESGTNNAHFEFLPDSCSAKLLVNQLEKIKTTASADTPA